MRTEKSEVVRWTSHTSKLPGEGGNEGGENVRKVSFDDRLLVPQRNVIIVLRR